MARDLFTRVVAMARVLCRSILNLVRGLQADRDLVRSLVLQVRLFELLWYRCYDADQIDDDAAMLVQFAMSTANQPRPLIFRLCSKKLVIKLHDPSRQPHAHTSVVAPEVSASARVS